MPDGTFRMHLDGQELGAMCMLGTFAEHAVISQASAVKVDDDIPLEVACLGGLRAADRLGLGGLRGRDDPLGYLAIRTLGGTANALGIWLGCARERTVVPLLPASSHPTRRSGATR